MGGVDAGAELGGEAGAVLGGVEPVGGDVVGGVALGLPAVGEVGTGLSAAGGAASRATVTASGSTEGVRLHLPASAVPCCPERVAAAT